MRSHGGTEHVSGELSVNQKHRSPRMINRRACYGSIPERKANINGEEGRRRHRGTMRADEIEENKISLSDIWQGYTENVTC